VVLRRLAVRNTSALQYASFMTDTRDSDTNGPRPPAIPSRRKHDVAPPAARRRSDEEQSCLPGFDPAPEPTDRLFFAMFPSDRAASQLSSHAQALRAEHRLQGQPLLDSRFQVTLFHLGDHAGLPQDVVRHAMAAAASLSEPAFPVNFDRALSFGRTHSLPLVLKDSGDASPLRAFHQSLGNALKLAGLGRWANANFTPHVTLLYDTELLLEHPVEPVRWVADEFVLVHSIMGQTRHVPLGRWRLRG
jgi:2'-5' RNA ligase